MKCWSILRFKAVNMNRPKTEHFEFNIISEDDNAKLIKEFSEEEIKRVVWECESLKSPGPDDVNLGFIK